MKKLILALALCSCGLNCPEYEVKAIGKSGGVDMYEIRLKTNLADPAITDEDQAAIVASKTCPNGFQDVQIEFEPQTNGENYKVIQFYCL